MNSPSLTQSGEAPVMPNFYDQQGKRICMPLNAPHHSYHSEEDLQDRLAQEDRFSTITHRPDLSTFELARDAGINNPTSRFRVYWTAGSTEVRVYEVSTKVSQPTNQVVESTRNGAAKIDINLDEDPS